MDLFLIRHAQSANNANPASRRVEDPPLTELGNAQCVHLARHVTTLGIDRLITSPFRRALQTAEYLRPATGLIPSVQVELHESGGCVAGVEPSEMVGRPGLTRAEILDAFPPYDVEAAIDGQGWWRSRPYESDDEALERAARVLADTQTRWGASDQRVVYVTHGGFTMQLLRLVDKRPQLLTYNAAITHLQVSPHAVRLRQFNQVDFLPPAMWSW
ncbi:MAG: histidine phosphatase family protein [Pirellulaceae bacterium]|jgi:2,3-bisphosphoglycerate-dependent phosphoglycerate mutase|nr:histidine phosphatase family protein [Pirellulaceae bacterium]